MIINRSCLKEFAEKVHFLPSSLTKSDLLTDPFRLHQENELGIYYSPHIEKTAGKDPLFRIFYSGN